MSEEINPHYSIFGGGLIFSRYQTLPVYGDSIVYTQVSPWDDDHFTFEHQEIYLNEDDYKDLSNITKTLEVSLDGSSWEIDNRNAVAHMGEILTQIDKKQRLPIQYNIDLVTEKNELPNGTSYYTPVASVDMKNAIDIVDADQDVFKDFMEYIKNYNDYINTQWAEKAVDEPKISKDDMKVVESFVDIDDTEVA